MEKIDVAELLKDCPSGMELDCVSYDNVSFDKISEDKKSTYPIFCYITDEKGNRSSISFTKNGCESKRYGAKCVIFPKGKKTWEGFKKPFKNGDIVFYSNTIAIFNEWGDETLFRTYCVLYTTVSNPTYQFEISRPLFGKGIRKEVRFATEEEKTKLFDAIKANGYKWNEETKTLERLPKFKVGDRIKEKQSNISNIIGEIIDVQKNKYNIRIDDKGLYIYFREQDNWELVPNKFDINTLIPFESKVLVRNADHHNWCPAIFGCKLSAHTLYKYATMTENYYAQCVPYEGNEHLSGTTDDCDEYFKNW